MVYLDSSVLIAFLYEERDQSEKFSAAQRFMEAVRQKKVQAAVSFYALPELYDFVKSHQSEIEVSSVFRLGLVELFLVPLDIFPFLSRELFNDSRKKIVIVDADDARHVAVALTRQCSAIITFDHHFQQVRDLIPVFTPDEYLATLTESDGE
ncbi:MAG: PIN domain-containing protein [Chloroflexi bacterium]|nr:PIN domain-containing protein [Chloroflexota bacterium]